MLSLILLLAVSASGEATLYKTKAPVTWLQAAPDGKHLVVFDRSLQVFDRVSGRPVRQIKAHRGVSVAAAITKDGRVLTLGLEDKALKLIDLGTGAVLWSKPAKSTFRSICGLSPDDRLAVCSMENEVRLVEVATGRTVASRSGEAHASFAGFTPDGARVVAQWLDGTLRLMDTSLGNILTWSGAAGERGVLSPDGRLLYLSGFNQVQAWDVQKGNMVLSWRPHLEGGFATLALSPDGTRLLTGVYVGPINNEIRQWDARTAQPLGALQVEGIYGVSALAWTKDGIFAGSAWSAAFLKDAGWKPFAAPGTPAVAHAPAPSPRAAPKPSAPPKLVLKVAFEEPSGDQALDGRETGAVRVEVLNEGPGPAYGVRAEASVSGASGVEAPRAADLGEIRPGTSASAVLALSASARLAAGKASVRVEAREANGFDADPKVLEVETRPFRAPRLELAGVAIGGTGLVKAGEPAKITLTIRNAGDGDAAKVEAALDLGSDAIFPSGDTKASLGAIAAGQSGRVEFEFFVNKRFSGTQLPVSVSVAESWGEYGFARKSLGLVLGEGAPSIEVVSVKAREEKAAAAPAAAVDDVDAPPVADAKLDPDSFAVVVGIEKYRQSGLPAVDYAARDASSMRTYLTRAMGYDARNVILLQNEQATKTDLEKYLGTWLRNRVGPTSRVFVYYAGHGAPNPRTGETFLVPYEGDPSYAEDTSYPVKRLYDSLAKLPTRDVTVVLDACFSGAGGRSVIAKGARPLVTVAKDASSGDNTVVLTATSADQISTFYPDGQHGLLTYFLLKGLKGEADADGDGVVGTGELFGYVRPNVEREARLQNVEQSPTLSSNADVGRPWLKLKKR